MDDSVSSKWVEVTCHVNPLTYEIIQQNKDKFEDDDIITRIIHSAVNRGQKHGRVACPFSSPANHPQAMKEAERMKKVTREALIRMHIFVMNLLDIPSPPH